MYQWRPDSPRNISHENNHQIDIQMRCYIVDLAAIKLISELQNPLFQCMLKMSHMEAKIHTNLHVW